MSPSLTIILVTPNLTNIRRVWFVGERRLARTPHAGPLRPGYGDTGAACLDAWLSRAWQHVAFVWLAVCAHLDRLAVSGLNHETRAQEPTRARLRRNGNKSRFPRARPGGTSCMRPARLQRSSGQPNAPTLHPTMHVRSEPTNQTRPTLLVAATHK